MQAGLELVLMPRASVTSIVQYAVMLTLLRHINIRYNKKFNAISSNHENQVHFLKDMLATSS